LGKKRFISQSRINCRKKGTAGHIETPSPRTRGKALQELVLSDTRKLRRGGETPGFSTKTP